jgi:hypothetical protein
LKKARVITSCCIDNLIWQLCHYMGGELSLTALNKKNQSLLDFFKSNNSTPTIEKTVDLCRWSFVLPVFMRGCG